MDIIGAIGYSGQDFVMLEQDTFGYITGKGICVVSIATGPKEMIWRTETGISRIASHRLTHRLAIVPELAKYNVEVIDLLGVDAVISLRNPSSAKIVDVDFSRDGEHIFAISSSLNPKVFAWNLKTRQLIFTSDLPVNFLKIVVCPADRTKFALSGDEGLYLGSIVEIMGVSTVKYDKIILDSAEKIFNDKDPVRSRNGAAPGALLTSITFAVWAPFNRLFIGTKGGVIGEVDSLDLILRIRALIPTVETTEELRPNQVRCIPLCATISSSTLLVGTSSGAVLWYPIIDMDSSYATVEEGTLSQPIQNAQFEGAVCSLQTDFMYVTVLAGTSLGSLMKFPLDVAEIKRDDDGDDVADIADSEAFGSLLCDLNQTINATRISVLQPGAVLCCESFSMPVLSSSDASLKTTVLYCPIFMTGSHSGVLTFWKQPSVDSEPIRKEGVGVPGIRRSTPRAIKMITTLSISPVTFSPGIHGQLRFALKPTAVASLGFLPFNQKTGFGLIMVGTMAGLVESWKVCAFEAEEEDEVVNADEEDVTVKLKFVKFLSKEVFRTTLSLMTCSVEEAKHFHVAVGSPFDDRMFILKIPADYHTSSSVELQFAIRLRSPPSSFVWVGRSFWIACQGGDLSSFSPSRGKSDGGSDECVPQTYWESSLSSITSMCAANKGESLIASNVANELLRLLHVQSENTSSVLSSEPQKFTKPSTDSSPHTAAVVCITSAQSGMYIAAGCVDGSVHIWSIVSGELKLAARVNLHKQAVLALSFSVDSSIVMSCGADGSVFLSTVHNPSRVTHRAAVGDSKVFDKVPVEDIPVQSRLGSKQTIKQPITPLKSVTWFEAKKADAQLELKLRSVGKVSKVATTVEGIMARLKIILDNNNGRDEDIEKLSRDELVIDLEGRDRVIQESESDLQRTRNLYLKRNLWNEAVASRVKEQCWDSMDVRERLILPFNADDKTRLSSFSILSTSKQDRRRLEIVKRLRGVEIRSQRAHSQGVTHRLPTYEASVRTSWTKAIHGLSSSISWLANDGSRWPTQDVVGYLLRSEKGEDSLDLKVKEKADAAANAMNASGTPEGPSNTESPPSHTSKFGHQTEDEDEMSSTSVFESDREIDESSVFNLLYTPGAIRTQVQKRTQIVLLTEIAMLLRANFNSFFEKLSNEKEDLIATIRTGNVRLLEILEELKQEEVIFNPKLLDEELIGTAILITDEELVCRPYETEAIKNAKKEEELRRKEQLQKETENFKGRALKEMMHGTLEVKRDVFADVASISRSAWMEELTPSEMTEGQIKELAAFECKLKVMQEEQLKYRKLLEQEMKKLKSEMAEICKQFDEKIADVVKLKLLVQQEILTQELYMARLGLTMVKREQAWGVLKKTEAKIEAARKERAELRARSDRFIQHVESVKISLSAVQEEERAMDKTFKRDFQTLCNNNFDQDSLKVFADLYRRREYAQAHDDDDDGSQDLDAEELDMLISGSQGASDRKSKTLSSKASKRNVNTGSRRMRALSASKKTTGLGGSKKGGIGAGSRMLKASKGGNARSILGGKERLGPMQEAAQALKNAQQPDANDKDPFFIDLLQREKLARIAESRVPLLMSLNIESDCPENFSMDQYTWSKLQELRGLRIEKEIQSKRMALEYGDLKRKLDDLTGEENAIVSDIGSLRLARDETLAYLDSIENNLEVLVCLKQGQDEVDKDAAVTEYAESVLVPTTVVDKYNTRIQQLGREKVSVLSRIKQYRRKINLTEWHSDHLAMETRHMEEYFTDLQLLRVTRELQQIIRDGSNTKQTKERLEKVAVRRDFLLKDSDSKAARMRESIEAIKRQLQDREEESLGLEGKLRELKVEVTLRRNVKESAAISRGDDAQNAVDAVALKMKKIVARRVLLESARSQAEEADSLRIELDRVRQRSFPSFVKATKQRTGVIDER